MSTLGKLLGPIFGGGKPSGVLDPAIAARKKREAEQENKFRKDLSRYDAESQKYTDELRRSFATQADTAQGLAQRGTQATVSQFLQRRGIDSTRGGLGASLANSTQAQLQGQTMQAKQSFSTTLYSVMQQQRDAFINKEFDFFRRIDLMGYEAELQKDILRFQQQIQSDLNKRSAFMDILKMAGTVGASFIPGVGPAVSAAIIGGGAYSEQSNQQWESNYGSPTYGNY